MNTHAIKGAGVMLVALVFIAAPAPAHAQFTNNMFTRAVNTGTNVFRGLAAYSQNLFGSILGASGEGQACNGQSTFLGIGSPFCGSASAPTTVRRTTTTPVDNPDVTNPDEPIVDDGTNSTNAPNVGVVGECVVNVPHRISMSATDNEGDAVRFHIDWNVNIDTNGDGIANNDHETTVPPTGYATAGDLLTAQHTHTTAGTKTVRVRTEDSRHAFSSWASISFSCVLESTGNPPADSTSGPGGSECAEADCSDGSDSSDFSGGPGTGSGSGTVVRPIELSINATPVVTTGGRARVSWTASNAQSCDRVTGTNGDRFGHLQLDSSTFMSPIGGVNSSNLFQATTFTLRCYDDAGLPHTDTAVVRLRPRINEF